MSPAFLNYGRHPEAPKSVRRENEQRSVIVPISEKEWVERLKKLDALRDLALQHINEATEKQMKRFNQGRKVKFFVGDRVMRRTRILSDAAEGINAKLCPLQDGPFTILQVLSPAIYILDMGPSRRSGMSHVSELKKFIEPRGVRRRKYMKLK